MTQDDPELPAPGLRGTGLRGRRILVVEDEYLAVEILLDILEQAGAIVLGPIGWADEALAYVRECGAALDGAVLDVNLHGHPSYGIADALVEQGVPFVFATGYDEGTMAARYRGHPRCPKPFERQAILAALAPPAVRP